MACWIGTLLLVHDNGFAILVSWLMSIKNDEVGFNFYTCGGNLLAIVSSSKSFIIDVVHRPVSRNGLVVINTFGETYWRHINSHKYVGTSEFLVPL